MNGALDEQNGHGKNSPISGSGHHHGGYSNGNGNGNGNGNHLATTPVSAGGVGAAPFGHGGGEREREVKPGDRSPDVRGGDVQQAKDGGPKDMPSGKVGFSSSEDRRTLKVLDKGFR